MEKKAVLVVLAFRKSSHAAKIAMLFPQGGIDMAYTVERRDEFVTVPRGALRELLGTGEVEPDTFETARQGRHSLSPANLYVWSSSRATARVFPALIGHVDLTAFRRRRAYHRVVGFNRLAHIRVRTCA
jgi:hypothetical protein